MLTKKEAEDLMITFIDLRTKYQETKLKEDKIALEKHQKICIEDFKYLVTMKTGRYKSFNNYDDLNQEGLVALVKAMKTYKPKKGCFFAWAHHYIGTRISRSANLHTTIRYPLKVAKETAPHKETMMPIMIEETHIPDKEYDILETNHAIHSAISTLNDQQKEIINLAYGFHGDKPLSVNKICKILNISRLSCLKTIDSALSLMKENIII
jgi:RNA polymerase sigma factor (sigma-70 family)